MRRYRWLFGNELPISLSGDDVGQVSDGVGPNVRNPPRGAATLSSKSGTNKTVKARFWPWSDSGLGLKAKVLKSCQVVPFSVGRAPQNSCQWTLPQTDNRYYYQLQRSIPEQLSASTTGRAPEINISLPKDQRKHRTLHMQKDVLPYAFC